MSSDMMQEFSFDAAWVEFKQNGTEHELDEMDLFQIKCRRNATLQKEESGVADLQFQSVLESTRCELSKMRPLRSKKCCVFCKNNKEREAVYTTHVLKDALGRVVCPILSKYTCPLCLATGTNAHTIKYCPFNDGMGTVDALLQSPRNCAGRRRLQVPKKVDE